MIGGFALVAYPATYAVSGITTFIVSHDGVVYQKDFGPKTPQVATAMKTFNPDKTWTKSRTTRARDDTPRGLLALGLCTSLLAGCTYYGVARARRLRSPRSIVRGPPHAMRCWRKACGSPGRPLDRTLRGDRSGSACSRWYARQADGSVRVRVQDGRRHDGRSAVDRADLGFLRSPDGTLNQSSSPPRLALGLTVV